MKRVLKLTPWAAMAVSLLGLTATSSAVGQTAKNVSSHGSKIAVINLHRAYEARLKDVTDNPIAGIMPLANANTLPGRGGNECAEPQCPVSWQKGSVQLNPHVYLLLWGPGWSNDPNQEATASYLQKFYQNLGAQPADNWSTVTEKYSDSSGHPTFQNGVLQATWQDMSTPPVNPDQDDIAAEADTMAANMGITDLSDAQIVVATESGVCPPGFAASSCSNNDGNLPDNCGWHSYSNEAYINLPYLLDASAACGEGFINNMYDGYTITGSHEYADAITDPVPHQGWWDPADPHGGEVADKCNWTNSRDVALAQGSFAMQPLWSNDDGDCVMPVGGTSDIVTVQPILDQSTYQDSSLNLTTDGASTNQNPLTWTASGLPTGLTIDSSTGLISGQIKAALGVHGVQVTASDATGASGFVDFNWTVKADVGTPIKNIGAGVCLNDIKEETIPKSRVAIWNCGGGAAEMWTHPSNSGELIVLGQCLTVANKGGANAFNQVTPCTGAANQIWYHNSQKEYVELETQLCLTDVDGATRNGVSVQVEPCTGAADQKWSGT